MSLTALIRDPHARIDAIARFLDELDHDGRWEQLWQLSRGEQRMLYEKAAESAPLDLSYFVGDAGARVEVIHDGRNTLPLPPVFRRFQKRFCRPSNGSEGVFGYNEGRTKNVVGPGYFVAVPTTGRPHWEARGAVVIDYFRIPDSDVAPGWPDVVPNSHGLQRFVYHETRDFMRRVSQHVSVGAAFKRERPLDHYFVLCRKQ